MQVSAAATVNFGMSVAELREVLDSIPDNATVDLFVSAGDHPFAGIKQIMFSWTVAPGPQSW